MSEATTAPAKPKLYNTEITLLDNVEVRQAKTQKGEKPYVTVRVSQKNGKEVTVMTMAPKGVAALEGQKKGATLRVFGSFTKGTKGRTFAVLGLSSPRKPKAEAAS